MLGVSWGKYGVTATTMGWLTCLDSGARKIGAIRDVEGLWRFSACKPSGKPRHRDNVEILRSRALKRVSLQTSCLVLVNSEGFANLTRLKTSLCLVRSVQLVALYQDWSPAHKVQPGEYCVQIFAPLCSFDFFIMFERVQAAAVDGRQENVFWRQIELQKLYKALAQQSASIQAAIVKDSATTRQEAKLEFCEALLLSLIHI